MNIYRKPSSLALISILAGCSSSETEKPTTFFEQATEEEYEITSEDISDPALGGDVDTLDAGTCKSMLTSLGATFKFYGDVDHTNSALGISATVRNEVDLINVAGVVNFVYKDAGGEIPHPLRTGCSTAIALVNAIKDFRSTYPNLKSVLDIGSINVRYIANTNELSQHATGSAVDLFGIVYGTKHIMLPSGNSDTTFNAFYDSVVRNFGQVLGPRNNEAHKDHLHAEFPKIGVVDLPDLVVDSVALDTSEANVGTTINGSYMVRNLGTGLAQN